MSQFDQVQMTVRLGQPADWEIIARYNCQLARESEQRILSPDVVKQGVTAVLGDSQKGRYFLACIGNQVIGQMMHTREWSDWRNGEIWWLQSVYVSPEFRRMGVFKDLLLAVRAAARETPGVVGLRLYVESHNQQAIEAYLKSDFTDSGYVVMELLAESERPT